MNEWTRAGRAALSLSLGLGVLWLAGCRSAEKKGAATESAPSGYASVVITGHDPLEIAEVAEEVFREAGYSGLTSVTRNMIFEREGGTMSNIAYGNWLGGKVWVRVRAAIVPLNQQSSRLQCRAYMVRDLGTTTEEEIKAIGTGPYQKLLDEVSRRLAARTKTEPAK